jgi:hypothetical protein
MGRRAGDDAGDEWHPVERGRPCADRCAKRDGISTAEARQRLGLRPQRISEIVGFSTSPPTDKHRVIRGVFLAASGRLFHLEA